MNGEGHYCKTCKRHWSMNCDCKEESAVASNDGLCAAPFTEDDLETCWPAYQAYLLEILNGEYPLEDAKEDLRGLIGSKYDPRTST